VNVPVDPIRPYGDAPHLVAVAAHGLAGTLTELPSSPLRDDEWRELLAGVRLQRLPGLLARAIDQGAMGASSRQVEQATDLHLHAMTTTLKLEAVLVRVAGLLGAAGLPFRVLKGAASSHLDFPDPSMRSFQDIDILVPPEHLDATVRLLGRHGFGRRFPAPRPGFDARFGKAVTLVGADQSEIDLHRTFALGPFGQRIQVADLWSRPGTPFFLAGTPATALDPDLRLLNAAYHCVLGDHPARLMPMRDIAQLALGGQVSATRVLALVAGWQGEAVLAQAVRATWDTLQIADMTTLSTWADRYRASPREERDLSVYLDPGATFAGKSYAAVRGIPRLPDRLAYLRALLLPQSSYLGSRHDGRIARLRQGTSEVFGKAPKK
jgi:hypothetical protein